MVKKNWGKQIKAFKGCMFLKYLSQSEIKKIFPEIKIYNTPKFIPKMI